MPSRCVVYGCSNIPDPASGIILHKIPYDGDLRPEAVKRRKVWINFVKRKRAKWEPSSSSCVCSKHFNAGDFERIVNLPGQQETYRPVLKRDDIGITSFPSVYTINETEKQPSDRAARAIKRKFNTAEDEPCSPDEPQPGCSSDFIEPEAEMHIDMPTIECHPEVNSYEKFTQTMPSAEMCEHCLELEERNRLLRNQVIDVKQKLAKERSIVMDLKSNLQIPVENIQPSDPQAAATEEISSEASEELQTDPNTASDDTDTTQWENLTETEDSDESDDYEPRREYTKDDNLRTEPKFIVFLSQLMLLFQSCQSCKSPNPLVETSKHGTKVVVHTYCGNSSCKQRNFVWHSQPNMEGTKIAAGNFLLSFAILVAGGSISKVRRVFTHMGMACISMSTFFRHQKNKLFPAISLHWKKYQEQLINKFQETEEPLTIAGDGRHDSMGHSAKYCAYTMFCCTSPCIFHFSLVQRNEAGSSQAMEYLAFQHCMEYVNSCGISYDTLVTDRHTSIAKHMREKLKEVKHYFDLWHLRKKIGKVLSKIAKESDSEEIQPWIRPCENHLSWSATSTSSGDGRIILAKFLSFLGHIVNKHENLDDPVFDKCAHGDIQHREWLDENSVVYEKVRKALTNKRLKKGIQKASPLSQTSCLEGFHSVLNQFAPKMIAYTFPGMYIRHILAAIHFNNNLNRKVVENPDGSKQHVVVYPKFKNGEATVRDVKVAANFCYVQEIYETFLDAQRKGNLKNEHEKLKKMTPKPMNVMLNKQPREEAIKKRSDRRAMVVKDVPPTATVSQVDETTTTRPSQRAKPHCSLCHQPMKGHKKVLDCPRNKQPSN